MPQQEKFIDSPEWPNIVEYTRDRVAKKDADVAVKPFLVSGVLTEYILFLNNENDPNFTDYKARFNELYAKTWGKLYDLFYKGEIQTRALDNAHDLLSVITTTTPTEYVFPTANIPTKAFTDKDIYDKDTIQRFLVGTNKKTKAEIRTALSIDFEELEAQGVQYKGRKLTSFDREVHDAIITLFSAGETYITSNQVYQVMTGNVKSRTGFSPQMAKRLSDSFNKFMYGKLTIDGRAETELGYASFERDAPIVPAERIKININGNPAECLHLLKAPTLLEYSQRLNQVARVPIALLSSPGRNTPETISIRGYLIRRIEAMRAGMSKSVKFDTIYKYLDVAEDNPGIRNKKKKIRDTVFTVLDYFKEERYIKGYETTKNGKTITGVTISL